MATDRRAYNQFCGLARSLDVVGERWTLLVVRNLLLGPLRYSDLLRGLPGITTNLLAKRLREMEEAGLVERVAGARGAGQAYRLTSLGLELEPAVHALGRWGWRLMQRGPRRGEHRSLDWLLVALRRRYRGGATLRVELVADDVPYRIVLAKSRTEIARGDLPSADLRLRGTPEALARMFVDRPAPGERPAGVTLEGREGALQELLDAFAPGEPEPATR